MITTSIAPAPPAAQHDLERVTTWLEEDGAGDIIMNPDGWLLDCNRAAARMFGLPDDYDGRGLNIRQFCRYPERFLETVQAVQVTGRLENWDGEFVALDGAPLHVVVNLVGNFDECRALRSIRAYLFNITEWRREHERTMFGQRIETIGKLAGGIAHDFNNLLTVIGGHADVLATSVQPGDPLYRSIEAIQECSARAAALTQKLLAFGRRQVLQPRLVDLAALIATVEHDLRRTFGRRIAIGSEVDRPLAPVRVDPAHIERAIGTIAAHAIDVMPDGGAITLRARTDEIGVNPPRAQAFVQKGRYVRIEIACSGMTLDDDAQVRVFEPFFLERGSVRDGLGLAAVFGVIKQSGGYIWLDTGRSLQSTFTVLLPVDQQAEAAQQAAAPTSKTIVVVDDDDEVRGLIAKILQHQGYELHQVSTSEAAAEKCAAHEVGLLISDVVLAGTRGDEQAVALLGKHPQMKLMCISGYPEATAIRGIDPTRAAFLEKPFSAQELVKRVRDLLPI